MKLFVLGLITAMSFNASAIEFITEADVQNALGAESVIEISKYVAQERLLDANSDCVRATGSRSGRAYVVKTADDVQLYATSSGLDGLQACGSLAR